MSAEVVLAVAATGFATAGLVVAVEAAQATQPRRPDPGPSSMDLGDEPPALVGLVTSEFDVTTAALPATGLDLAARGWMSIEEPVWSVHRAQYQTVRQGVRVRATVSPRLRWVEQIDVIRDEPSPEPATAAMEQAAADLAAARCVAT